MTGVLVSNRGKDFFPSPPYPDQLWTPHNLLSSGYWGLFPGDEVAGA